MGIIQIGAIGVIGAILAIQFKSGKSEYGIYISIALSLLIFFSIVGKLETIVQVIKSIGEKIQIKSTYITALLKMLGVTYVAEFSSAICKDAGYQTIAQQIEIFLSLIHI